MLSGATAVDRDENGRAECPCPARASTRGGDPITPRWGSRTRQRTENDKGNRWNDSLPKPPSPWELHAVDKGQPWRYSMLVHATLEPHADADATQTRKKNSFGRNKINRTS